MRRFMMDGHALKSCDFIPRVEKGGGALEQSLRRGQGGVVGEVLWTPRRASAGKIRKGWEKVRGSSLVPFLGHAVSRQLGV